MNLEYEQRTRERKEAMAKAKAERKAREEIPGTDEFKAKERTKARNEAFATQAKMAREAGAWNCMSCYNCGNIGETCGKCGKPRSGGGVLKPATKKVYAEDFAKFDADGDGFLNEDEVEHLLQFQLGRSLTGTELSDYFAELDTNKDGKVSLDEYVASLVY